MFSFKKTDLRNLYNMHYTGLALCVVLSLAFGSEAPGVRISDLSSAFDFEKHITNRENLPWAVLFVHHDDLETGTEVTSEDVNIKSNILPAFWRSLAHKVDNSMGMGYVDCVRLIILNPESKRGFGDSFCAEAKKRRNLVGSNKKKSSNMDSVTSLRRFGYSIQGWTFLAETGALQTSSVPFLWDWKTLAEPSSVKLKTWLLSETLLPNLVVTLGEGGLDASSKLKSKKSSSKAGEKPNPNVLGKEDLGHFLQFRAGTTPKALIFSTATKGSPTPVLLRTLALVYRQKMLLAEIKASESMLRKTFRVNEPPAVVLVPAGGGPRETLLPKNGKNTLSRADITNFLDQFVQNVERDVGLHSALQAGHADLTHRINISGGRGHRKQSYSTAESADGRGFPKGFNPWKILSLTPSQNLPDKQSLKNAYRGASKQWHPDKCGARQAKLNTRARQRKSATGKLPTREVCEDRISQITLAHEVLTDSRRLQQWEAWREDTNAGRGKFEL